jgi:hypothetical protein
MTMLGAGLIILAIAFSAIGFLWVLPAWRGHRGKKTVTCPETGQSATVEVDAARVAVSAWGGMPDGPAEGLFAMAGAGRVRAGLRAPGGGVAVPGRAGLLGREHQKTPGIP